MIDFQDRSLAFKPLMELEAIDDLFLETHYFNGKVYFMGSQNLLIYDTETEEVKKYEGDFVNIFELGDEIFVNTAENGTMQILDTLITTKIEYTVSFSSKRTEQADLAVSFDNELLEYKDERFSRLPQSDFIEQNGYEVKEIKWVNDSLFACSTFENGVILFNKQDPSYAAVTNYQSGLPDNEVYTIHTGKSNGIWVAHQFGLSHISPIFPAYSYSHFNGLNGNLTSVSDINDQLWVSTSLGLFYFDQDTIFENKVYYEIQRKQNIFTRKTPKKVETEKDEKPLLKRLLGKKKRANGTSKEKKGLLGKISNIFEGGNKVEKVKGKLDRNAKYVWRIRKIPVDIQYSFSKVAGANGKFLSITPYQDKLLGISTSGIYEISKSEANIIIPESVRSFTITKNDQLIISTNDLELKTFSLTEEVWVEKNSSSIGDIIVSMSEDEERNIWMAGSTSIYRATTTDSTLNIDQKLQLNNIFLDEVNILNRNDSLYFINSLGYFYFNKQEGKVQEDLGLKTRLGSPLHHLFDPIEGGVWVFNGKVWHHLKKDGTVEKLENLGLFPDLRAISIDRSSEKLWLITQSNELLKYDPQKKGGMESLDFFLKRVSNEKGDLDQSKKFSLSYYENFLSIELSKPDFLGLLNPEFQYKLDGLHLEWSDWTSSKSIDFSFLPEGNYKLLVKSRDAFGRIEEGEMLAFS
ncbi:MAG: hypothetical protein HRT61_23535, partial [Ekhidna sp.]|nr:hypothetical protein [Ekhidna sp.]